MAASIASPVPQPYAAQPLPKRDFASLQLHEEEGRSTPLPQYEKPRSVPFRLTLQEDKNNPGQFQLVVNLDSDNKEKEDSSVKPAAPKKLYADLQPPPSLGYDVSSLYRTQKSSPPRSPQQEKGWSDLDAIPPDFLERVVPDWEVTFQRKDSTASTHSRKLADIKARIKKSGKGFVVRLLKGSNSDSNEVAEVHLGQGVADDEPAIHELDSSVEPRPPVELDAADAMNIPPDLNVDTIPGHPGVFEIGTSNEPGVRKFAPPTLSARMPSVPHWLKKCDEESPPRHSIVSEEGFSDAETLTQDVRPCGSRSDDEQTDHERMSNLASHLPTRTTSTSSIVKTPTRGLSVVGPIRRVGKGDRSRLVTSKGKGTRSNLTRSDARKSFKRHSPRSSNVDIATELVSPLEKVDPQQVQQRTLFAFPDQSEQTLQIAIPEHDIPQYTNSGWTSNRSSRRSSIEDSPKSAKPKARLRLQTAVPRVKSANASPTNTKKRPLRNHKRASSSSVQFTDDLLDTGIRGSDIAPDELRKRLEPLIRDGDDVDRLHSIKSQNIPQRKNTVVDKQHVGEIPLPHDLEIRVSPVPSRHPALTLGGLAISALLNSLREGLQALQTAYGSEPQVPPGHVRVRWTCTCGEPLHDDFIERRLGAARLLEAYLNRPRSHTPTSPTSRASTSSTISSVFDSVSRASTLATPVSTYGGSSWSKGGESSRYSPTRLRGNNPFSVRVGSYHEEQWLLTCANEGRFTPKIVHIDVNAGRIKSDKDLAWALREHYEQLSRRWFKWARLRGLTTIEFVQFEVHRNRFADIRATPSMPPRSAPSTSPSSEKSPSTQPYSFEPVDLIPPVGSAYLLHLFKHPNDYDGELITYLRSPKRRERLEFGMGWGINLVEGFLAHKVWTCIMLGFGVGSAVFAILWTIKKGDVQGAFGVAGWIVTLAGLALGAVQSWLE